MENLEFDKHYYYLKSVQAPEADLDFINTMYKEMYQIQPKTLREDFCGTFALCCEWVKYHEENISYGVDIDSDPINYGKSNYLSKLLPQQQERVFINKSDVLSQNLVNVDVVCALNFSYYLFKKREQLKRYFKLVHRSLNEKGVLVLDSFGGSKCHEANEEETEDEEYKYSYFWDQDNFNPITNEAQFYIHFKRQGEKRRERVFSYDWRMWSIVEIRELLEEAGFKKSLVYWEGTDEEGEGDGNFSPTERGEECDSWVAYIVACK